MTNQQKITISAIIGTLLEWAEYCFYGYSATRIASLFFPQFDARVGIIAAFAVFALGYVARPLGGLIFGYIGDIYGRKKALSSAISLMGLATLAIGCLPTYTQIGLYAPILLVLARLIQGIAVSGEFTGAAIYLIENAKPHQQYLASSWVPSSAAAGMLLGAGIVSIVSLDWMPEWAWRIPFFLGALSCVLGFVIRKNAAESPEFLKFKKHQLQSKMPLLDVIKDNPGAMLKTMVIAAFVGIYVYTCNVYFASYLIQYAHFNSTTATLIAAIGQACTALLTPIFGYYADKSNGNALFKKGLMLSLIAAPLNFFLADYHLMLVIIGQLIYALANAMFSPIFFKYLYDLFPACTRFTGITVAWGLSVALFSSTSPFMAAYLAPGIKTGLYVSVAAFVALASIQSRSSYRAMAKYKKNML